MHIVQINDVDAQSRQALLARLAAVLGRAVDPEPASSISAISEFGREKNMLALAGVGLEPLACDIFKRQRLRERNQTHNNTTAAGTTRVGEGRTQQVLAVAVLAPLHNIAR